MHALGIVFFALAVLGGTALIAGTLWMTFAHSLWGRVSGPPPGLSPEEARAWTVEHDPQEGELLSWEMVRASVRAGRWREVWPALFVIGGAAAVFLFLPLGILLVTRAFWSGIIGLAVGILLLWRGYTTLWRQGA